MELNYREKQLLVLLLNNQFMTGFELSQHLKVSDRSIRSDIKNLNSKMNLINIKILGDTTKGYSLEADSNQRHTLFEMLQQNIVSLQEEPKYRIKMILLRLLEKEELHLFDITETLWVSESTIQKDLKQLDILIKKKNLTLTVKKHCSKVSLQGDEKTIRAGVTSLLLGDNSDLDTEILSELESGNISFIQTKKILLDILNNNWISLLDDKILFFILYCFVSIVRIQSGFELLSPKNESSFYNPEIIEITNKLADSLNVSLCEAEIANLDHAYSSLKNVMVDASKSTDLYEQVREISAQVDQLYGTKFMQDYDFLILLSNHICSHLHGTLFDLGFTKNTIDEIEEYYPYAYNLAKYFIEGLSKLNLGRNFANKKSLIAFCAIHIQTAFERSTDVRPVNTLLISHLGHATTNLLEVQLKNKIPNLIIQETIAPYALQFLNLEKIDLIVTTKPLSVETDIPSILIEMPLRLDLIEKIKSTIISKYYWAKDLYPVIINVPVEINDERGVIDYIESAVSIIEGRDVNIAELLWKRETLMPSAIGNYIAMPHALVEESLIYHFYFFYHKVGMKWGEETVHLIATILITSEIKENINEYMKLIYDINLRIDIPNLNSSSVSKLLEL